MKPRCRWRIGMSEGLELVPYRLHVSVIENRRIDGKVQQEQIADLGAVDGYLLPEFWVGIDPSVILKVRSENWDLWSVRARVAFWETANPRLARLANRLDPKAIRMAVHDRIPWPKQAEREMADAREEFREWWVRHKGFADQIENYERIIEKANKELVELRPLAAAVAEEAGKIARRMLKP
jgi:hypothetical protein